MSQNYNNRDSRYSYNKRPDEYSKQAHPRDSSYRSSYRSSYHNNESSYREGDDRRESSYHKDNYDKFGKSGERGSDYGGSKNVQKGEYNTRDRYSGSGGYGENRISKDQKGQRQRYEPYETRKYEPNNTEKQRSRSRNKEYISKYDSSSSYQKPSYKKDAPYQQMTHKKPYDEKQERKPYERYQPKDSTINQSIEIGFSEKSSVDNKYPIKESYHGHRVTQKIVEVKSSREKTYQVEKIQSGKGDNQKDKRQPYYKENRSFRENANKDYREPQHSKDVVSIEVKSRHRPSKERQHKQPKIKKDRNSSRSYSISKSKSRSKKSKQRSKRKYKRHQSSRSSSSSSSNSSSSSSSSSNNSSSSSSSRSSSSSDSKSAESRSRKHYNKEYKDFYQRREQPYQRPSFHQPSSSHNPPYQKDRTSNYKNPNYKPYNCLASEQIQNPKPAQFIKQKPAQNTVNKDQSAYEKKYDSFVQRNFQKSEVELSDKGDLQKDKIQAQQNSDNKAISQQKPQQSMKPQAQVSLTQKDNQLPFDAPLASEIPQDIKKTSSASYNDQRYPYDYNRDFQQRDTYRKPYPGSYPQRQPYQARPYYNSYYNNGANYNQNNAQLSSQSSNGFQPNQGFQQPKTYVPYQSYPPRNQVPIKASLASENDSIKPLQTNLDERKPYTGNAYQNYPPPQAGFAQQPYQQSGQGYSAYPRNTYSTYQPRGYQQPYSQNKPYQRTFSNPSVHNNSTETHPQASLLQQQNPQRYQPYQNTQYNSQYQSSEPNFRRTVSDMPSSYNQRKYPPYSSLNEPDMSKTQFPRPLEQQNKEDLALLQQAFKRECELKKINSLIPCSKVLELVEKARQNLTIPAVKSSFLMMEVFREMSNFRKETMNPNLKAALESDLEKKYDQQKIKVFKDLKLLNLEEDNDEKDAEKKNQSKENGQKEVQVNGSSDKQHKEKDNLEQSSQKMDFEQEKKQNQENLQNPQSPKQSTKLRQFMWKKPEMSQNLRVLKSNIETMRKASSCLSEISRKIKMKFDQNSVQQKGQTQKLSNVSEVK